MSFYITTPIYYVNDVPHLGHAYTTVVADALMRFHRARGEHAYFLTGTDEHGEKIEKAATARGKKPIELADEVVERFRETWVNLDIANDDFIRTTEDRHKQVVADMWKRLSDAGDIYLGSHEGHYCVSCEVFYPDNKLLDGNLCPTHKSEVEWRARPSYMFRMSKYQQPLLDHFEANPDFVQPSAYRKEILSFINEGLRDLSVSRNTFSWGVPVPGDDEHVIYVWIDALTNYISALGGVGAEKYDEYWPAVHLIGKDILRFHAVYWPCMLLSAGLPLPKTILAHGWWSVRGEKISKSMPATRVDPNLLAADIGADAVRYHLLREVPLGLDGDFTYEGLIGRYNSDLANDLGNLLNRTLTMTSKFCDGTVPEARPEVASGEVHANLARVAVDAAAQAAVQLEGYHPSRALEAIWKLVREANKYVDACQPWKLAKDPDKRAELEHCTRSFLEAAYWAACLVAPVMPNKALEIARKLGVDAESLPWPTGEFNTLLPTGSKVDRGDPLFPRIDADRTAALLDKWIPDDAKKKAEAPAPEASAEDEGPKISFDEFMKLDLRVAEITAAEPVPKTKKLLQLQVAVGGETRQVVAGIAEAYPPNDLVGRKVIFVANLEPATIRGIRSEGMILAAGDKKILGLSAVDRDVPTGTRIR
jgi:methionyl-tRNA synthetase